MPQLIAIVLKDDAAVDHTFAPENAQGGLATLVESTGVPIGDKRLSIGKSQTAQGRRKVTVKLAIPVIQDAVVGGVTRPTVVRTSYADMTFSFDASSSTAERKDILAFVESLCGNATFASTVNDLQALY